MGMELIKIGDEGSFGPAMRALPTDRQRAFVIALLDFGNNHTRAAMVAGYSGDVDSMKATAYRLFHDDKIQEAIHEEAQRRLSSAKIMAVSKLVDIAESSPEPKDRLKAIGMILNRVGMHEKTEHHVVSQDISKTDEAMVERIKALAARVGWDAKTMLKDAGVVDAEFTEVESSTEGIEDLL